MADRLNVNRGVRIQTARSRNPSSRITAINAELGAVRCPYEAIAEGADGTRTIRRVATANKYLFKRAAVRSTPPDKSPAPGPRARVVINEKRDAES